MLVIVAHEDHAALAGLGVQPLLEPVGADVLIQDDDLRVRFPLFEREGVLERDRAADAAAELIGWAHALNHDNGVRSGKWEVRSGKCGVRSGNFELRTPNFELRTSNFEFSL